MDVLDAGTLIKLSKLVLSEVFVEVELMSLHPRAEIFRNLISTPMQLNSDEEAKLSAAIIAVASGPCLA